MSLFLMSVHERGGVRLAIRNFFTFIHLVINLLFIYVFTTVFSSKMLSSFFNFVCA